MKYRNSHWGFEITLPNGWRQPGILTRVFSPHRYGQQASHPEFYSPHKSSLKFAIGPIYPASVGNQQKKLERIANKYQHEVLEIGQIHVNGKDHATMICKIPHVGVVKNYSLIFGETEYLVTATGNFDECDSIAQSFKVGTQSSRRHNGYQG